MAQVVIGVKTLLIILAIIYILLHFTLLYAFGFNLIAETINFIKWILNTLLR